MKKIEILGTGCPKCNKTEKMVKEVVEKLGVDAEVIKVSDLNEIVSKGVMMTPAVVIDGEIKVEGKVPTEGEIQSWLE